MYLLAGDIGGTKTAMAAYVATPEGFRVHLSERYPSREHAGLEQIASDFAARARAQGLGAPAGAAFGVAGPVTGRQSATTNLPWRIDADHLQGLLGAPCALLNDFAAVALGVGLLRDDEQHVLQANAADPQGPICVLGAGTGLGEAVLVPSATGPRVLASEGGHSDFAPRNPMEAKLLAFLWRSHERVSVERVVSGLGLPALYDFVCETGLAEPLASTRAAMAEGDRAAVVGELGQRGADPACRVALDLFVDLYGAEAGNLALKVIPTGGLFVAGGIAPRLRASLSDGRFMHAFCDKGRMRQLLERVRVAIVLEPRVGLFGAARQAGLLAGRDFTRAPAENVAR